MTTQEEHKEQVSQEMSDILMRLTGVETSVDNFVDRIGQVETDIECIMEALRDDTVSIEDLQDDVEELKQSIDELTQQINTQTPVEQPYRDPMEDSQIAKLREDLTDLENRYLTFKLNADDRIKMLEETVQHLMKLTDKLLQNPTLRGPYYTFSNSTQE